MYIRMLCAQINSFHSRTSENSTEKLKSNNINLDGVERMCVWAYSNGNANKEAFSPRNADICAENQRKTQIHNWWNSVDFECEISEKVRQMDLFSIRMLESFSKQWKRTNRALTGNECLIWMKKGKNRHLIK